MNEIPDVVRKQIEKSVNYILKGLQGDLSLEKLAAISNYSPFHFQKLFKSVMGESPKQYVKRMRLETAAHYLIIHKNKSIQAIAMDCGFSSPAVFSRAFKNYFEVSAEEFRQIPQPGRIMVRKKANHLKQLLENTHHEKSLKTLPDFEIEIKRLPSQPGICVNTSFHSMEPIEKALKQVMTFARAHDIYQPDTQLMGIMYPHHNIYRAFIPVPEHVKIPSALNQTEIRAGKYACFKVTGSIGQIFEKLTGFHNRWLPENGYKLADIFGFEIFSEPPFKKNYNEVERIIYVPIEPL